jgi:hypothetical protein
MSQDGFFTEGVSRIKLSGGYYFLDINHNFSSTEIKFCHVVGQF